MIRPTDNLTFPVNCFGDLSTLMIRRNNKVSFTRSWREYRDGFGNLSDSHWLGLENMHILTSLNRKYRLIVHVSTPCPNKSKFLSEPLWRTMRDNKWPFVSLFSKIMNVFNTKFMKRPHRFSCSGDRCDHVRGLDFSQFTYIVMWSIKVCLLSRT